MDCGLRRAPIHQATGAGDLDHVPRSFNVAHVAVGKNGHA